MTAPEPASPSGASIRQALQTDADRIHAIIAAAYAKYASRMDRPPAPALTDYRPAIEVGRVWVVGDPVVGVLVLEAQLSCMLIDNIAVDPGAQHAGLGRRLMAFAEQQAASAGSARIDLYTNVVMTENRALYARLGYREMEVRPDDGYQRVFMAKDLPRS